MDAVRNRQKDHRTRRPSTFIPMQTKAGGGLEGGRKPESPGRRLREGGGTQAGADRQGGEEEEGR